MKTILGMLVVSYVLNMVLFCAWCVASYRCRQWQRWAARYRASCPK